MYISLPPLVFAIQSNEGRQLAGKSTASRRRYRGQDSILIILEYQHCREIAAVVHELWLQYALQPKILFTIVVESNAESIHQGSLRFFLKPGPTTSTIIRSCLALFQRCIAVYNLKSYIRSKKNYSIEYLHGAISGHFCVVNLAAESLFSEATASCCCIECSKH